MQYNKGVEVEQANVAWVYDVLFLELQMMNGSKNIAVSIQTCKRL
jgi:hypothetical protein